MIMKKIFSNMNLSKYDFAAIFFHAFFLFLGGHYTTPYFTSVPPAPIWINVFLSLSAGLATVLSIKAWKKWKKQKEEEK